MGVQFPAPTYSKASKKGCRYTLTGKEENASSCFSLLFWSQSEIKKHLNQLRGISTFSYTD